MGQTFWEFGALGKRLRVWKKRTRVRWSEGGYRLLCMLLPHSLMLARPRRLQCIFLYPKRLYPGLFW